MDALSIFFVSIALAATFAVGDTYGGGSGMEDGSVRVTEKWIEPMPPPTEIEPSPDNEGGCVKCY